MKAKEISIPSFLHDIHGKKASLPDLVFTYWGGIVSLTTILVLYAQAGPEIEWWKVVFLCLISADIGAGAVANFTKGTNLFYSGNHKNKSRITFILLHVLHPFVYFFAINSFSVYSILLVAYVIGSALFLNSLESRERQGIVAALLMVSGVSLLAILPINNPFLWWFFPLYMTKLFIAFGIRRYA